MLMSPDKNETAVHGCNLRSGMALLMCKVLAIPQSRQSRSKSPRYPDADSGNAIAE